MGKLFRGNLMRLALLALHMRFEGLSVVDRDGVEPQAACDACGGAHFRGREGGQADRTCQLQTARKDVRAGRCGCWRTRS